VFQNNYTNKEKSKTSHLLSIKLAR